MKYMLIIWNEIQFKTIDYLIVNTKYVMVMSHEMFTVIQVEQKIIQ